MEQFNVLKDPWIPLETGGQLRLTTYRELLTGAADGTDVVHPRDDLRFFARMLLSAITQAIFPVRDRLELERRIASPLPEADFDRATAAFEPDFELLGDRAFLQSGAIKSPSSDNDTGKLFLDLPTGSRHLLYRPPSPYEALCGSCATLALYGCQSFAASGGRGLSPGVRGAPPVTTLVLAPTVRSSVWANVLTEEAQISFGMPRGANPTPWRSEAQSRPGEDIGLLEGLFWQPRSVRFVPAQPGPCAACGTEGDRASATAFGARSKVTGGFFQHPYTPYVRDVSPKAKRALAPHYLRTDRPAWAGLADLLGGLRTTSSGGAVKQNLAAPVVQQWVEQLGCDSVRLGVLFYATDKAKIASRLAESFSVTFPEGEDFLIPAIRSLVELSDEVQRAIRDALSEATGTGRKQPGINSGEALGTFWQRTEGPFWTTVEALMRGEDLPTSFDEALRSIAMEVFAEFTDHIAWTGSHQAKVAVARRRLGSRLYKIVPSKEVEHAA